MEHRYDNPSEFCLINEKVHIVHTNLLVCPVLSSRKILGRFLMPWQFCVKKFSGFQLVHVCYFETNCLDELQQNLLGWVSEEAAMEAASSLTPWKLSWIFATACFPTHSSGRHVYITGLLEIIWVQVYKLFRLIFFLKTISLERTWFYCSPPASSVLHKCYAPGTILVSG